MVLDRFTTGMWTSPTGQEWHGLFGSNPKVPVVIFASEEDLNRFAASMNSKS